MTATITEAAVLVEAQTYAVVKAEIRQTVFTKDELSFSKFFGMMSYSDYVIFEYEVKNGLRSINDTFEISSK